MSRASQLARVERRLGVDVDFPSRLSALQAGDLRAVLLDVAARRAAAVRPADLLRRYDTTPAFRPSPVDPATRRRLETQAMAALPEGFVELDLAPHAPLGASSVLGRLSQDRILTTIADSEVVSDTTNVLALECAHRRRAHDVRRHGDPTRLAAAHRLLRPQEGAHFSLFALCTAGRDRGSFAMECDALHEHLGWHVRVITEWSPQVNVEVALTDLSEGARRSVLDAEVLRPMRAAWPAVEWAFDDDRQAGHRYYAEACFSVDIVDPDGRRCNVSDGGLTDWTARLLADRKERLLISGLGSERLSASAAPHTAR